MCSLSGRFLGIGSLAFSEFWHGARNPYHVVHNRAGCLRNLCLPSKIGEMSQKQGFLNLKKNSINNFHRICSIMKICLISSVLAQILYLGKVLFGDIVQNGLSQSDFRIFKSTISPKQINEKAWFFACWYKLQKLKVNRNFYGWEWSKIVWPICSLDSKIDSRMNRWNLLIFSMPAQIHTN